MTMKELSKYTDKQLDELHYQMACRGNMVACNAIVAVKKYYHKQVIVVKGRKVPIGTTGECFWMGSKDYSRYGDPWGIYTVIKVGIKDTDGNVYWTSIDNIDVYNS